MHYACVFTKMVSSSNPIYVCVDPAQMQFSIPFIFKIEPFQTSSEALLALSPNQ